MPNIAAIRSLMSDKRVLGGTIVAAGTALSAGGAALYEATTGKHGPSSSLGSDAGGAIATIAPAAAGVGAAIAVFGEVRGLKGLFGGLALISGGALAGMAAAQGVQNLTAGDDPGRPLTLLAMLGR